MIAAVVSSLLAAFCFCVDVSYFVKVFFQFHLYTWGFRKLSQRLHEEVISYGVCLPIDIDYMYHMNHAKYLRAFEYGRGVFVGETGLLESMLKSAREGKHYVVAAAAVRYRRQVRCFERYRIATKLAFVEGRDYYFEQRMLGMRDDFVRAVMFTKATFTCKGADSREMLRQGGVDPTPFSGPVDEDLRHFIEFNRASSLKLLKQGATLSNPSATTEGSQSGDKATGICRVAETVLPSSVTKTSAVMDQLTSSNAKKNDSLKVD